MKEKEKGPNEVQLPIASSDMLLPKRDTYFSLDIFELMRLCQGRMSETGLEFVSFQDFKKIWINHGFHKIMQTKRSQENLKQFVQTLYEKLWGRHFYPYQRIWIE